MSFKKDDLFTIHEDLKKKVDRTHFEMAMDSLNRQKSENQKFRADFESIIELLKTDLENIRQSTSASLNKKIDTDELDRILQILNRKPDIDQVNSSLIKLRDEVSEEINAAREDTLSQMKGFETEALRKGAQAESLYEDITQEVREINSQIRKALDEKAGKKQVEDLNAHLKKLFEGFQKETYENLKRMDEKCNLLRSQKEAQSEDLSAYIKKVSETLKREFDQEIRRIEEGVNKLKNFNDAQLEDASKFTKKIVEGLQQELYNEVQQLDQKLDQLKGVRETQMEDVNKNMRKSFDVLKQELYNEIQRLEEKNNQLRGQISEAQRSKSDFAALETKLMELLDTKTDLNEVQDALNAFSTDISRKFSNMKEDFTQLIKAHEDEVLTALKKKASMADLNGAVSKLESSLASRIERAESANEKAQKAHERQLSEGNQRNVYCGFDFY